MVLEPLDCERLRREFVDASPFPFVKVDNFLNPAFAREVAAVYPTFEDAAEHGKAFTTVNERRKVQITNSERFPEAVKRLNEALAATGFLSDLSQVTGIPNLLADEQLVGGGIHVTGPGGRLDVHVDFNCIEMRRLYRRLNLLVYLNPTWDDRWGGHIQLWDQNVRTCCHSFAPTMNRCVIFETSDISFHGVTPVSPSASFPRQSFAVYYYTQEPPPTWKGISHGTIFKARPTERLRRYVLMPAEMTQQMVTRGFRRIARGIKRSIGMGNSR